MISPTSSISSDQATRSTQKDIGNKDIFLKLLVAQMQNQDPLKPQDATQMSSQLAQFNMVDQQTTTNTLLQKIVSNGQASGQVNTSSDASYLGRQVTVRQNQIAYSGIASNFSLVTDSAAAQANVVIRDSQGNAVRTMTLNSLTNGTNPVSWDGLTDSGSTAVQGNYSIDVSAVDQQGNNITSHVEHSGIVNAVRFTASGTQLIVGDLAANLSDLTEIKL